MKTKSNLLMSATLLAGLLMTGCENFQSIDQIHGVDPVAKVEGDITLGAETGSETPVGPATESPDQVAAAAAAAEANQIKEITELMAVSQYEAADRKTEEAGLGLKPALARIDQLMAAPRILNVFEFQWLMVKLPVGFQTESDLVKKNILDRTLVLFFSDYPRAEFISDAKEVKKAMAQYLQLAESITSGDMSLSAKAFVEVSNTTRMPEIVDPLLNLLINAKQVKLDKEIIPQIMAEKDNLKAVGLMAKIIAPERLGVVSMMELMLKEEVTAEQVNAFTAGLERPVVQLTKYITQKYVKELSKSTSLEAKKRTALIDLVLVNAIKTKVKFQKAEVEEMQKLAPEKEHEGLFNDLTSLSVK
ncbi:MAG: hypothetical protein V4736_01925 [Bdellovibrionota bacterium]